MEFSYEKLTKVAVANHCVLRLVLVGEGPDNTDLERGA
jgi:hypothetical protein